MKPCPYCAEEIQDKAIKCKHCGEWLPKEEVKGAGLLRSISAEIQQLRLALKEHQEKRLLLRSRLRTLSKERNTVRIRECHACGRTSKTVWAEFTENKSHFFERRERYLSGFVCLPCLNAQFLEFELNTLAFTWWGIIGLMVGPIYLVMNIIEYLRKLLKFAQARTTA